VKLDVAQLLAAAQLAAGRAAEYLRTQEGRLGPSDWEEKRRADFVTEVDVAAERLIAATLRGAFPESGVVGEELSPDAEPSGLVWIVDPLDGTTNFLHRFPIYAVSIAAALDGELLVGVVHHVPAGIRYHAVRGGGAWRDGERISVSTVTEPRQALIGTGFPYSEIGQIPLYQRQFAAVVAGSGGLRRPGSAALDLCDVAAGRFDGFWELALSPWDVAAGALLVREAGGLVTDHDGRPAVCRRRGSIVAGNPAIYAWLRELLRSCAAPSPLTPDPRPLTPGAHACSRRVCSQLQ
jgi:myo-inositol-1(or 4)-monophosphatase